MLNMTRSELKTPDERFGEGVSEARALRGLSQKGLAAALTSRGFKVDASAVSRIEGGTRAVRLSEALIIANVLGVDLAVLLDGTDLSPRAELRRARQLEREGYYRLRDPLLHFLNGHLWVYHELIQHPELLDTMPGGGGATLDRAEDYFGWAARQVSVRERDAQLEDERGAADYVLYRTEAERQGLLQVAAAYADVVLAHVEPDQARSGGDADAPSS